MARTIHVFGDWQELGEPQLIGTLRASPVRGTETFSFEYDHAWLKNHSYLLDPELSLFSGPQYPGNKKNDNFGLFLDSSPDRWGRTIMQRSEAALAREQNRQPKNLMGSDYLLGVHDQQRMGGLRFKETLDGDFLSSHDGDNAPPWARLRELENAAWQIQATDQADNPRLSELISLLIAPGSSLGGARPKAGVCDEEGNLWIAKFPGRNDDVDVGAWEMVVYTLADKAGLDVTESRVESFRGPHRTFMTKRFDRIVENRERKRLHFASAMTMLGYSDGASHDDGANYLELVEFLMQHGCDVERDLHELWRRIVFFICVSNTDDHLRNHGFLLTSGGWKLSPAYDVNPNPRGTGLHLNISETDNSLSLDLARDVAEFFRLKKAEAGAIVDQVVSAVGHWRRVAEEMGIPRGEQELMRRAFRV
jgi:serine/threonine-protein kinase HipA